MELLNQKASYLKAVRKYGGYVVTVAMNGKKKLEQEQTEVLVLIANIN